MTGKRRWRPRDQPVLPGLDAGAVPPLAPHPLAASPPVPPARAEPPADPLAGLPFRVELVRSTRRTKTVGAHLRAGVLKVIVPSWMSATDAERWRVEMARRFARKHTASGVDLAERAAQLARRHDLPAPVSIRWAEMRSRWGSCTPATGDVRIATALAGVPPWVLDYVIVHELAHLAVADHSPAFWALVNRYGRTERARGYLIAKSGDDEGC